MANSFTHIARNGMFVDTNQKTYFDSNHLFPINDPLFRQSAMDGFALCLHNSLEYVIIGEVKSGDSPYVSLLPC